MYQARYPRADYYSGPRLRRSSSPEVPPFRRSFSPDVPPFPGDYTRFRCGGDCFEPFEYKGPSPFAEDHPFSPRATSPSRFPGRDYAARGFSSRQRDYLHRLRDGSPGRGTGGDYEDYFLRDDKYNRHHERRGRPWNRGGTRQDLPTTGSFSPRRVSEAAGPTRYGEDEYRRRYRLRPRSVSPVPYYGYSTLEQPLQETYVGSRTRSATPTGAAAMTSRGRSRMGGEHAGYVADMTSRYRRDNARRRELPSGSDVDGSALPHVERVEFYAPQNAREHHTLRYELVQDRHRADPVLRRGQPFYMAIRVQGRALDFSRERMYLVLKYGPRPIVTLGTKVYLPVGRKEFTKEKQHWDVRIHSEQATTMVLQVQIPTDCLVGDWGLSIQTISSETRRRAEFKCRENIFILFNPWCPDDGCYLEDPKQREEYVNGDTGKLYVGAHKKFRGRHWVFGQFDSVVLPAVQLILERSGLSHAERGSPVKVARAITGTLNSENPGGVLEGRWDGNYRDGTSPWTWTGSVRILERYLGSGGRTVKYGQCWVYSGLLTTVCRALGMPCRSVTNFVSAHDTDGTLTVDKFFDVFGDEIEHGPNGDTNDSLWNFHVWNEAWMARSDLPPGYGGWQAIDSTPQQESDNKFQCGPSSLEAVRRGEVGFGYDTTFLFSEVNADLVHWQEDEESDWGFSKIKRDKYHVGRSILTKKCGEDDSETEEDAEDITHLYKNPEGTAAERLAVFNAVRGTAGAQKYFDYPSDHDEDTVFTLVELETVMVGQPFKIAVDVTNKSAEPRSVKAHLHAASVYYTGIKALDVVREPVEFVLQPGQTESIVREVAPGEYMEKLVDYCMLKIWALAKVAETHQSWSEEDDFVISKPKLRLEVEHPLVVNKEGSISFSFRNPLDVELTDCMFSFEGSGLTRPRVVKLEKTVPPHEKFSHTETFVPREAGDKTIVASFQCRQLFDIEGSKKMKVSN